MKIYLSGAMTNEPNYREIFSKWEQKFSNGYYKVFNPVYLSDYLIAKNHLEGEEAWKPENRIIFLKEDVKAMLDCDIVLMLPNWEKSEGAKLEHDVAKRIGMEILYGEEDDS